MNREEGRAVNRNKVKKKTGKNKLLNVYRELVSKSKISGFFYIAFEENWRKKAGKFLNSYINLSKYSISVCSSFFFFFFWRPVTKSDSGLL